MEIHPSKRFNFFCNLSKAYHISVMVNDLLLNSKALLFDFLVVDLDGNEVGRTVVVDVSHCLI